MDGGREQNLGEGSDQSLGEGSDRRRAGGGGEKGWGERSDGEREGFVGVVVKVGRREWAGLGRRE